MCYNFDKKGSAIMGLAEGGTQERCTGGELYVSK